MASLLFALYSGSKQIDAKNLCICMVHSFSRWGSEAQKVRFPKIQEEIGS